MAVTINGSSYYLFSTSECIVERNGYCNRPFSRYSTAFLQPRTTNQFTGKHKSPQPHATQHIRRSHPLPIANCQHQAREKEIQRLKFLSWLGALGTCYSRSRGCQLTDVEQLDTSRISCFDEFSEIFRKLIIARCADVHFVYVIVPCSWRRCSLGGQYCVPATSPGTVKKKCKLVSGVWHEIMSIKEITDMSMSIILIPESRILDHQLRNVK